MANKTVIKIPLSKRGVDKALVRLKEYKKTIDDKIKELMDRLGEVGINTINATMQSVPEDDEPGDYSTLYDTKGSNGNYKTTIKLTGNKVLFIEFSAGVTYGSKNYPLPSGEKYGAGTYPSDKNNWSNPYGWWYPDEDSPKGYTHTFGNKAYMPVYHADVAICMEVHRIALEVFKDM